MSEAEKEPTVKELIEKLQSLDSELTTILNDEKVKLDKLAEQHEKSKAAVLSAKQLDKARIKAEKDLIDIKIQTIHNNSLGGEKVDTSHSLKLQSGNIIMISRFINKDPEFKWNAAGQKKGVAQLKSFGTALSKFIKIEEKVKWDDLKKNCTIDKVTGVVHFSDKTNKIEFDVDGIESTPVGLVHEITFEELNAFDEIPESTEVLDII